MKTYLYVIVLVLVASVSDAAPEIKDKYRTTYSFLGIKDDSGADFYIGKNGKFTIINNESPCDSNLCYEIQVKNPGSIDDGINKADIAKKDMRYKISVDNFDETRANLISGYDHGMLVVPFRVRDGLDISPGGTVGYYYGAAHSEAVPTCKAYSCVSLVSIGLSAVPINNVSSSDPKTEAGITLAVGNVWRINEEFQIGTIIGADWLDSSVEWDHQGKIWWSIAIGTNFAQ